MEKGSSEYTAKSGTFIGTIAFIAVSILIALWVDTNFNNLIVPMIHLKSGIIFVSLCAFLLIIVMQFCVYGVFSIGCTKEGLKYRKYIIMKCIPWSTIKNIAYVIERSGTRGYESSVHIYYKNSIGCDDVTKVALTWYANRELKAFFTMLIEEQPTLPIDTEMKKYLKRLMKIDVKNPLPQKRKWIKPLRWDERIGLMAHFSEATLFLMAMSFLILLWIDPKPIFMDLLKVLGVALQSEKGGGILILLVYMILGLLLSIYHILKRGKKSPFAKKCMITFGICMSATSGVFSGMYILHHSAHWLRIILAVWSIVYSVLLLFTLNGKDDFRRVQSVDAKLDEIVIGLIVITMIIYGSLKHHVYWSDVFGTCIAYATLVNGNFQRWFPAFHRRMPTVGIRIPDLPAIEVKNKVMLKVSILIIAIAMLLMATSR